MATHDVDRKILSGLARDVNPVTPPLAGALYQILGLSKMLSRRLLRARGLRRLEPTNDKSMKLYHHIIWMAREGLKINEEIMAEHLDVKPYPVEYKIFAHKLRASFYHIFCLFHNKPSVSPLNPAGSPTPGVQVPTVLLPVLGNRQTRFRSTPPSKSQDPNDPSPPNRAPPSGIRDSILSDTSNITNPFGSISGISPPPGLPGRDPSQAPDPAAFLLPSTNFIPLTIASFESATALAAQSLSGSSPLRLSIALENSAFKWDCLHDHDASRRLASQTIRGVYNAQEGMDDNEFDDAAILVGTLGRMMRRKSEDRTPRFAPETPEGSSPGSVASLSGERAQREAPPPVPPVPQISDRERQALQAEVRQEQEKARRETERPTSPRRPVTAQQVTRDRPRPVTRELVPERTSSLQPTATDPLPPRSSSLQPAPNPQRDRERILPQPTAELAPPSRPSTAGSEKPLPELPRDANFLIPRRPVGTPPSVVSTSRPQTATGEVDEETTPTQERVGAFPASPPEARVGKRKNDDTGSASGGGGSRIPRLRVRNP